MRTPSSLPTITAEQLGTQVHAGARPTREGMRRLRAHPVGFVKPTDALWTIDLSDNDTAQREGGAQSIWRADSATDWLLTVASSARIARISSPADAEALATAYPGIAYPGACLDVVTRSTIEHIRLDMFGAPIDFTALYADFDGLCCRPHPGDAGARRWMHDNGWDMPSCAWGRWAFVGGALRAPQMTTATA